MWTLISEHPTEIKGGQTISIKYRYDGDKTVQSYSTSCNCITAILNNNVLEMIFDLKVPTGDSYISSKSVFITYTDQTTDFLNFQQTVIK